MHLLPHAVTDQGTDDREAVRPTWLWTAWPMSPTRLPGTICAAARSSDSGHGEQLLRGLVDRADRDGRAPSATQPSRVTPMSIERMSPFWKLVGARGCRERPSSWGGADRTGKPRKPLKVGNAPPQERMNFSATSSSSAVVAAAAPSRSASSCTARGRHPAAAIFDLIVRLADDHGQ